MKIIIIIICFSMLNRCVTNTKDIGSKGREVASEKLEGTQRPCPQPNNRRRRSLALSLLIAN